jgi:hypothetical protein
MKCKYCMTFELTSIDTDGMCLSCRTMYATRRQAEPKPDVKIDWIPIENQPPDEEVLLYFDDHLFTGNYYECREYHDITHWAVKPNKPDEAT